MKKIEDVRLRVLLWYSFKHASLKTLKKIVDLLADRYWLTREVANPQPETMIQPRAVRGSIYQMSMLGATLAFLLSWWSNSQDGYCRRLAWREGYGRSQLAAELSKQYCTPDGLLSHLDLATAGTIEAVDREARAQEALEKKARETVAARMAEFAKLRKR